MKSLIYCCNDNGIDTTTVKQASQAEVNLGKLCFEFNHKHSQANLHASYLPRDLVRLTGLCLAMANKYIYLLYIHLSKPQQVSFP